MGIARRSPQLFSSATIAGISVASQMALGLGAANASEGAPELGVAGGASNGAAASPPPLRSAGIEIGSSKMLLLRASKPASAFVVPPLGGCAVGATRH